MDIRILSTYRSYSEFTLSTSTRVSFDDLDGFRNKNKIPVSKRGKNLNFSAQSIHTSDMSPSVMLLDVCRLQIHSLYIKYALRRLSYTIADVSKHILLKKIKCRDVVCACRRRRDSCFENFNVRNVHTV